ncbi:MAG TPA: hypothetical protein VK816_07165, partial [Jatrophihabitantaceae bacterium]|nr:hypothetical protein [Jatrophihabitantaceae bacterium]
TQILAAQKQVVTAQKAVDTAQARIDAAQRVVDADVTQNITFRNAQQADCATSVTPSGAPTPSPTGSGSNSSAACMSAMADYQSFADTLSTDMTGLDTAIGAQDGDIKALDTAISSLDRLVTKLQSAAGGAGTTGGSGGGSGSTGSSAGRTTSGSGSGSGSGSTSTSRTGSGSGSTGSGQSQSGQSQGNQASTDTPASASQLAADQAEIDAAQAQLALAQQNLAAATLTSPISGVVGAVGLTAGSNSGAKSITILGTGVEQVDTAVPLSEISLVKAGESVSVMADGQASSLHGTVTSIALLSTTTGSSVTFPVTVALDAGSPHLFDGSGADVAITTGTAANAITVPNSAIHTGFGTSHTVTVVKDGKASTVQVTLGVAGTDLTQVETGLKAGQQVEIADPSVPLPSSASSASTSTVTGRFAGFTGGAAGFARTATGG